jgi:hypothetical protein
MRERTVDSRDGSDRLVDLGPMRAGAAEFARHREREQARVGDPLFFLRGVTALMIALRRARTQRIEQSGEVAHSGCIRCLARKWRVGMTKFIHPRST